MATIPGQATTGATRTWDRIVPVDGVALGVRGTSVRGEGERLHSPLLVFLHDSLGCVATWRDFPQALAERVGLDAIAYDRRGHGESAPFPPAPRTPRYHAHEADVLLRLLDALAVESAVLFGHSDGGTIALYAAAMAPARIRAIVSEAAHVFVEEVTLAGIREAREALRTTDLRERLVRHHGDKADGVASAWIDTWLRPEFRDWNMRDELPRVVAPVLALQGEADEFGSEAQVRAIVQGVRGPARALILPGIGHTPHRDARDAVLEAATSWIRESLAS
ncbi:MAG TPA: alpha/beta hydrolase [Gemmatimonadaceae bacterium]|nr:alpha/beta hydrolase [Gemmatimonadaceae bacterium]